MTRIDGFELQRMLLAEEQRLEDLLRDDNLTEWGKGRMDGIKWAQGNVNLLIADAVDAAP